MPSSWCKTLVHAMSLSYSRSRERPRAAKCGLLEEGGHDSSGHWVSHVLRRPALLCSTATQAVPAGPDGPTSGSQHSVVLYVTTRY